MLKLSLDRGDLWDLRSPEAFNRSDWNWKNIKRLVAQRDQQSLIDRFEVPYKDYAYPTKLPAGRIELALPPSSVAERFSLDLRQATGRVELSQGRIDVFCYAEQPVGFIRVTGAHASVKLVPAHFDTVRDPAESSYTFPMSLADLGYPPGERDTDGLTHWYHQRCADDFAFALVISSQQLDDQTIFAFAVTTSAEDADPVALGRRRVAEALDVGFDRAWRRHKQWWKTLWSASAIAIPDQAIEQHYYLVQYFYGAASRRGAPPMPLQGVWTADDDQGRLPPWKGDYHHDMNTQLCYWAYLAAGHWDQGLSYLDFMWDLLPQARKYAREFYDSPGACVPTVMTLDGKQLGGWHQYGYSATNGAWVACAFHEHWRYTMDRQFLDQRAYPYCQAIGECLEALLEPGADGKLKLPLSSSSEIHDNRLEAWMTPNTNYDLVLLLWLFTALAEMAQVLGRNTEASHWQGVLNQLDDPAVDEQDLSQTKAVGPLLVAPGERLSESHRHHSHLMAIYPANLLHIEGSDRDRAIIEQSLLQLDQLGTGLWCGFSFSWMAAMAARCGQGQRALHMLECFLKAFISRNGFHLNGDYKNLGLSMFKYRPFTLEGNFAAAQAVHEMLLQSWANVVRIFPAVPPTWQNVSFENLRAAGGYRVCACRENARTVWIRITADHDGRLRLRDPFAGAAARWTGSIQRQPGDEYHAQLSAGESIEARV